MLSSLSAYFPLLPQVVLLVFSCVILLLGAFHRRGQSLCYYVACLGLLVTMYACALVYQRVPLQSIYLNGVFIWDDLAMMMQVLTCVAVFFSFMFLKQYNTDHDIPEHEFYALALFSTLGMCVLSSSQSLLTLYLGIELLSLPIYAMVALKRSQRRCLEASMKYFIMGALASGFLLYGFSLLFGVAKSLNLNEIAMSLIQVPATGHGLLLIAMVFIVAGVMFKLGAVPFHLWVPDVYDGAPNSVTLFLSSAPKLAVFALLTRLLLDSLYQVAVEWQHVLMVMGVLSIVLGNLAAVVQVNIKRMLAYSSIAHMGYMLLGFCAGNDAGYSAALFYMITYVLMSVVAFGILSLLSFRGEELTLIADLGGLNERNPWIAFMFMLVLFSLAGVPPLVGFISKIGILEALISAKLVSLAVIAIIFAIVGVYYYIRVVKVMYFDEPEQRDVIYVPSLDGYLAMSIGGVTVLMLGIFPGALFALCHMIF